jgi:hypothetical protein
MRWNGTEAVQTGEKHVPIWIPDPPSGLVVSMNPDGKQKGWRISHQASGYAIGLTLFPMLVAKKLCIDLANIGVDWTKPVEYLLADRERIWPLVSRAAQPYEGLQL